MALFEGRIKDRLSGGASIEEPERAAPAATVGSSSGAAATALEFVCDAAEAIRLAENHAAEQIAQVEELAKTAAEKLQIARASIERAEEAQRRADSDLADLKADVEMVKGQLRQAEARFAARSDELAAADRRANLAEKRAEDAEAAIERILEAIRTQFPRKNGTGAAKPTADE